MVKVLDACALMAYLGREPGYEKIKVLFVKAAESGKHLLMSTINWGEVFYVLIRDHGLEEAERVQKVIENLPIEFVPPDIVLTKQAAQCKAKFKLPYADCFAAALAMAHKGELVTQDSDFKAIEKDVKVVWIV